MRRLCLLVAVLSFAGYRSWAQETTATASTPLTLQDLLQAALGHDGRILAAAAELESYRAQYDEAQRSWFPQIKLLALFGGPVSERRLACDPPRDDCLQVTNDSQKGNFQLGQVGYAIGGQLEAMMPLYTFGKLSGVREAASAGVHAGEAGIARARQDVVLEVRRAYLGWLLANSALEVLQDGQGKLKEAESKLVKMLDDNNEEVTDRDLFKLRYYGSQIDTMLLQAQQGLEISLAALRFLTGIADLGAHRPLAIIDLEAKQDPVPTREDLLSLARQRRPDLMMLQSARQAAESLVEIQRASFYPDFFIMGYLKGSYSPVQDFIKNPLLNGGLTNYDGGIGLGMQVTLDIPQKLARLAKAKASSSKILAQSRQAEEAVGLEIDKRLSDLQATTKNLDVLRKGQKAAKAWVNANMMDYGVGITNTKDLLDSLAAHAKSKLDLDKGIMDQLLSWDQLNQSAGQDLSRTP